MVPRDAIFLMTCDKSTTTETAARWAMQHQMKLQRGGSYGREVFKGIYAAEQSEGKRISVSPDGLQRDRFASCTANRARARPTCIVTKRRKRCLSRSRETVRLSWTASASKCRKEPSSGRPDGLAGAGKRLKISRCLYGFGRHPAEELSPRRTDSLGRRDSRSKKGTVLEESVKEIGCAEY